MFCRRGTGRSCTVQNPWPGRQVQFVRGGKPAERFQSDRFTFQTAAGEAIELPPIK
jgi:alpha-L-fucosidase 2